MFFLTLSYICCFAVLSLRSSFTFLFLNFVTHKSLNLYRLLHSIQHPCYYQAIRTLLILANSFESHFYFKIWNFKISLKQILAISTNLPCSAGGTSSPPAKSKIQSTLKQHQILQNFKLGFWDYFEQVPTQREGGLILVKEGSKGVMTHYEPE